MYLYKNINGARSPRQNLMSLTYLYLIPYQVISIMIQEHQVKIFFKFLTEFPITRF